MSSGAAHLDTWSIHWGVSWLSVTGVLVVGLIVAILSLSTLQIWRACAGRRRAWLLFIRWTTTLTLGFVAMEPIHVRVTASDESGCVAVLIDQSRSMGHFERARQATEHAKAIAKRAQVRFFTFGEDLHPTSQDDLRPRAHEGASQLSQALRKLSSSARPTCLSSVVVVSDGLFPELSEAGSADLTDALEQLQVPVMMWTLPDPEGVIDLQIEAVRVSPFAVMRQPLEVEVDLRAQGVKGAGLSADVVVSLNDEVAARTRVFFGDKTRHTTRLEVVPRGLGAHVVSVHVSDLPGEVTAVNNVAHRRTHVVRDKTRVLHLSGHPSWDTRFLRGYLRQRPSLELVSFYIMVGPNGLMASSSETALIRFPTETLFGPALNEFDWIIFQDFDFQRFDISRFLPDLRRWVERGGAFWVLGGPESLANRGWHRSSINGWLPLRADGGAGLGWTDDIKEVRRTALGARHLVTQLASSRAASAELWRDLTIEGLNLGVTPSPYADVLLQTKEGEPVLVVGEQRRGRTAVIATDSLWTWAFPDAPQRSASASGSSYERLLRRLQGWTLREPEFQMLKLSASQQDGSDSGQYTLQMTAYDAQMNPRRGAQVRLRAQRAKHLAESRLPVPAPTDVEGLTSLSWRPPSPGVWTLTATDDRGEVAHTVIAASSATMEDLQIHGVPDREAAVKQMGMWMVDSPEAVWSFTRSSPQIRHPRRASSALWSSPWLGLMITLLLLSEWFLRRRWGMA